MAKPAVPPVGRTAGDAFGALVELMRILRSPGGCPWDREQTLDTLKPFVLEEAHEVIDAIERRDFDDLQGEIGDLIFEGVFLAQLCADEQRFTVTEALRDVHAKLVRRHPHVFGDASGERPEGVDTPNAVKGQWEQVKADERAAKGQPRRGMFDGIPKTLPALLAAYEIGNRAAATGFDWPAAHEVLDKIEEEIGELRETLERDERTRASGRGTGRSALRGDEPGAQARNRARSGAARGEPQVHDALRRDAGPPRITRPRARRGHARRDGTRLAGREARRTLKPAHHLGYTTVRVGSVIRRRAPRQVEAPRLLSIQREIACDRSADGDFAVCVRVDGVVRGGSVPRADCARRRSSRTIRSRLASHRAIRCRTASSSGRASRPSRCGRRDDRRSRRSEMGSGRGRADEAGRAARHRAGRGRSWVMPSTSTSRGLEPAAGISIASTPARTPPRSAARARRPPPA